MRPKGWSGGRGVLVFPVPKRGMTTQIRRLPPASKTTIAVAMSPTSSSRGCTLRPRFSAACLIVAMSPITRAWRRKAGAVEPGGTVTGAAESAAVWSGAISACRAGGAGWVGVFGTTIMVPHLHRLLRPAHSAGAESCDPQFGQAKRIMDHLR